MAIMRQHNNSNIKFSGPCHARVAQREDRHDTSNWHANATLLMPLKLSQGLGYSMDPECSAY